MHYTSSRSGCTGRTSETRNMGVTGSTGLPWQGSPGPFIGACYLCGKETSYCVGHGHLDLGHSFNPNQKYRIRLGRDVSLW